MGRSSLGKAVTGGARTTAGQAGGASNIRRKSNPPPSSGSSTGEAGKGLVGEPAKRIVALEKKVNKGTASKAEITELKKLETANEEATRRARVRASESLRNRKGVMPTKPEEPKDAVATYMKTGKKLEGFTPTPRQVEQYERSVAARRVTGKKAGGKVMKRKAGGRLKDVPTTKTGLAKLPTNVRNKMGYAKSGGKVSDTKNATPRDKPTPPIGKGAVARGNRISEMEAKAAKAMKNKMGGGQVMKYKKGGMIYKKGGGVIKASDGDSFVAGCYTNKSIA